MTICQSKEQFLNSDISFTVENQFILQPTYDSLNKNMACLYLLRSVDLLWDMASELLFIGDAGTTEPSSPSKRYGVEWNNFYAINNNLSLDLDLAWAHSRFVSKEN